MIQDIAPHTYDPVFRNKEPEDRDYVLHYEYNKVMLMRQGDGMALPTFEGNRQIIIRSTVKLPQPFASWSNLL